MKISEKIHCIFLFFVISIVAMPEVIAGEKETITIFPKEEGIYNYYDKRQIPNLLGQLRAVSVVPSDEFEGIIRDLI
jgi:hypothetical protein